MVPLSELISERQARKEADKLVREYAARMANGELIPAAPKPQISPDEAEQAALKKTADRLRLYSLNDKNEKVYDWEAARAVQQEIRDVAREQVAPFQHMTLTERANKHVADVWAKAAEDGIPKEAMAIAEQEFKMAMGAPNAAQLLSQREVVDTIFERALGKAYREGKLTTPAKPTKKDAPVVAEPAGRRAPAASAVQLSPALQRVYRQNGIDPTKAAATPKPPQDDRGYMELK